MPLWGSKKNGDEPSRELVPAGPPAKVNVPPPPPPRERYDAEFVWRCSCGSMGTNRESLQKHVRFDRRCEPEDVTEYVPREVYDEEFETKNTTVAISGMWVVVKMPADTPEGELKGAARNGQIDARVVEAKTGLEAIQKAYTRQVGQLVPASDERDRREADARYVAIDFFTGQRAEAKVEAEWRANVEVAEGSHG